MNATPRLVIMAALSGLALSSCVSYDPYAPYSYGNAYGGPPSSVAYYDSDYVAYPRYSSYNYSGYGYGYPYGSGYGYGYAGYPYSSLSLGFYGSPYSSSGYYGHRHHHHYDSASSYSPPRTFRGAPLNAAAPATPNVGAPRHLPRTSSSFRSSAAPTFSAPSAPMQRFSRPAPTVPSRGLTPRSAPMPTPAPTQRSRITREPTTAATAPAASAQVAASSRFSRFR